MPLSLSAHQSPQKYHVLVTMFGFPLSLFFLPFLLEQINFWQMFGKSTYSVIHIYKSCCFSVVHILSSLKPENNLGKCRISCYEFWGSCLLNTIFELFRILILENSKPSMVLHIYVLDSWKVNRNRDPD